MQAYQVYQRTFEGQIEQLPVIHDFVEEAASKLEMSDDDAFACRLVVDEAATNGFEHAYGGEPGRLEVTVGRDADCILLSVRDWGAPFDPALVREPDLALPLEQRPAGGLGLYLMRKFMDEVRFSFDPQEGNTVTMRRLQQRGKHEEEEYGKEEQTMEIAVSEEQGRVPVTVLHLTGPVIESEQLQMQAQQVFDAGARNLVIDLSGVPYMASPGLRALHQIYSMLRADESDEAVQSGISRGVYKSPHLKLSRPSRDVLEILRATGYDMFLEIHPNVQAAVGSF